MANPEHVEILERGVNAWNRWRSKNPNIKPDLSGITYNELYMADVNFSYTNLSEANLFRAILLEANLDFADFSYTVLSAAILEKARFFRANFNKANLIEANMVKAFFEGTLLSGAEFYRSIIGWTTFSDLDISETKGLDTVEHKGPSNIGINTIYKSKGQISEIFLRGCGVPENFITYQKSLTMSPIEYYSCFISHATKDAEFAKRLYSDLQHEAVRCWYAPEDMKGGKKIYPQIDEAIKIHDKLVLILSESSTNSPWVATEIKRTKKYAGQEGRQRLFPISLMPFDELRDWELFDADSGTDLAAEVRSYFIPDFSNWKDHDSYKKAFDRLLSDLKARE